MNVAEALRPSSTAQSFSGSSRRSSPPVQSHSMACTTRLESGRALETHRRVRALLRACGGRGRPRALTAAGAAEAG